MTVDTMFTNLSIGWRIAIWVGVIIGVTAVAWLLTHINKLIFKHIQAKKKGLHLAFFQHVVSAVIVIGCFIFAASAFSGAAAIWQTMLGGTAIVSAVLAFAAQDVIKDILAGLVISINRPFEIGNRILLDNGTAGIVESITMRHVVLRLMEDQRIVIPNSKINAMQIVNYSYERHDRCIHFRFSIGYDSDVELAKQVIAEAVEKSEYTVPVSIRSSTSREYTPVYFEEFADSALIMTVNVYYGSGTPTEIVKDDINTRVRNALIANGIEIPYNYINVIEKKDKKST